MKSVTPNWKLLTILSGENNFEKSKIKLLEEEIKKLKNENATFRENILTQLNPFVRNAPFLYPLKISENPTVFWCFQEVEKGCIGNEWVKTIHSLSGNNDRNKTNTPIKDKTKQNNDFNIILIGRLLILLKTTIKDRVDQRRSTLKLAINLFHCWWKIQMMSQNTNQQI